METLPRLYTLFLFWWMNSTIYVNWNEAETNAENIAKKNDCKNIFISSRYSIILFPENTIANAWIIIKF